MKEEYSFRQDPPLTNKRGARSNPTYKAYEHRADFRSGTLVVSLEVSSAKPELRGGLPQLTSSLSNVELC